MPTGRLEVDGTWRSGQTHGKPYSIISTEGTVLPWLQGGFAFTRFMGVPGFGTGSQPEFVLNYGNNRDKSIFGKVKLTDESQWTPAVALYLRDPIGTSLFKGNAIAASKRFEVRGSVVDATVGYGTGRLKGAFGGVTATVPAVPGLKLLLEKDSINYTIDPFSSSTGLIVVKQPIAYGLNYRHPNSNWELRLASKMKTAELQVLYVTDNNLRDSIPKRKELPRFRVPVLQPTAEQWRSDNRHALAMRSVLHSYGFEQVAIDYDSVNTLRLTVSHPSQLHASSAVGDAVHIALKTAPAQTQEIKVRYLNTETQLAIAEYTFTDLAALNAYVQGKTTQAALLPSVRLSDPFPSAAQPSSGLASTPASQVLDQLSTAAYNQPTLSLPADTLPPAFPDGFAPRGYDLTLPGSLEALGLKPRNEQAQWSYNALGIQWQSGGERDHRIKFSPTLASYFNGPAVYQYSLKAAAQYDGKLADKTYASVVVTKTLNENIASKGIADPLTPLPSVRSRTAFYQADKDVSIDRAVINRFEQVSQNVYARANVGLFERAYAGIGAQVLWTPKDASWAADIAVDAVAQRSESSALGLNGYRTMTALASLHYRLPMDVQLTARVGQFLAKDKGVKIEFTRRFWSGIELGAWASVTDAKDFAFGQGNYRDKGIAVNIPFDALMDTYSRQKGSLSLQPWTRDAGQVVRNPADLYDLMEDDIRSKRVQKGLERFAGVSDYDGSVPMGALGLDQGLITPAVNAVRTLGGELRKSSWGSMATAGALFTVSAALSDRSVNKMFTNNSSSNSSNNSASSKRYSQLNTAATATAALGLGTAALWAYDPSDFQRSQVALASLEASASAIVLSTGLKYLTGRARPSDGLGASSFGSVPRGSSSFVSRHMATATALVTPLALHYDAPILYALPALTALGRVGTRQHWFSDVAAGGALGYALGHLFYNAHASKGSADSQRRPVLFNLGKDSINIVIPTE